MDEEYVKQLEKENEFLRNKIEMNPTLADILKKYFCLSKEVNRKGEESYGLTLTPMAQSKFLRKEDYDYLKDIGVHEEYTDCAEYFAKDVTVTNDDKMVNKILDEYYKSARIPPDYMKGLEQPCPVKKIDDYTDEIRKILEKETFCE